MDGGFVESATLPEKGSKLDFTFETESDPEPYDFQARVVEEGWYELGSKENTRAVQGFQLAFSTSSAETSRRLRSLIETEISRSSKFSKERRRLVDRQLPTDAQQQQRAARLRQFFEESAQAMFIADAEGHILERNAAAGKLIEVLAGDDVVCDENFLLEPARRRLVEALRKSGGVTDLEARIAALEGLPIDCSVTATERRSVDGGTLGYAAIVIDRREDNQRRDLLALQTELRAVGQFAWKTATELNDRLSTILAISEALRRSASESSGVADWKTLDAAIHATMDLTRKLLRLSGEAPSRILPIEPNHLARRLAAALGKDWAEESPYRLVNRFEARGRCRGDEGQLSEALRLLIARARESMPDGGTVELATADQVHDSPRLGTLSLIPAGRYVRFSVRDAAGGLDSQQLRSAVVPYSLSAPRALPLGLAPVWGLINRQRGFLDAAVTRSSTRIDLLLPA